MGFIYHMADKQDWEKAMETGFYAGSANDLKDGFIHFSTAQTLKESAAKHRAGVENLLLLTVDASDTDANWKWEEARGGQLFPHYYGQLPMSMVITVQDLPLGSDGLHIFPAPDRQ